MGLGFRVQGSGIRIQCEVLLGFGVQGLEFRVEDV
jgi:hypothetical protein